MIRAFQKRVRARIFKVGQLVLKRIFPHQDEYKGKFAPNWQGPYMVLKVLSGGALVLSEMDGIAWPKPINSDVVKRYYVGSSILHFLSFTCNRSFCLYMFHLNSYPSCNELRLTWILENEIRRRPMSASVTPFMPFKSCFVSELRSTWILKNEIRRQPLSASVGFFVNLFLLTFKGNYVWPDSCLNGIRRRHKGSVIPLVRFLFPPLQ